MPADSYDPSRMDAAIAQIRKRVANVAHAWGKQAEAQMRATASWNDRNGPSRTGKNARESLHAETAIADNGDVLVILSSERQTLTPWRSWRDGAPVGAFLELSTRYMQARPVIWPVARAMSTPLMRRLKEALP